jgi:hypothetical protein
MREDILKYSGYVFFIADYFAGFLLPLLGCKRNRSEKVYPNRSMALSFLLAISVDAQFLVEINLATRGILPVPASTQLLSLDIRDWLVDNFSPPLLSNFRPPVKVLKMPTKPPDTLPTIASPSLQC